MPLRELVLIPDLTSDSCIKLVIFRGIPNRNGIRLMHFVVILFLQCCVLSVSQSSHNEKEMC